MSQPFQTGVFKAALSALRAGLLLPLLFLGGCIHRIPVSATCSVDKSEVWAGEPVQASAQPHNFNPKHTFKYEWATNGGKVQGTGDKVTVDTTGVAEGQSYNLSVHLADAKKKKLAASCQTTFATKKRLPPTISCNANPNSVTQGDSLTIHSDASNPQGGQVTVAVQSDCSVTGRGTDVSVNTVNVQPGTCNVTCNVTDDHQLTGSSTTSFTVKPKPIEKPPTPPPSLALRSVYFATAQPTERNPNAGLVKSQQATLSSIADDFKKYLAVKPDAKLVLEAHADPRGSDEYNQKLTQLRAARVKSFMEQQGIPGDSLETRPLGKQQQLTPEEVRSQVNDSPDLTPGEKTRILRNMRTIVLANNRRVDIRLVAPGVQEQTSAHRYPWSAEDALSLIGGREVPNVVCSADRTSVAVGETVTIHCKAKSPLGGPVTLTHKLDFGNPLGQGDDLFVDTANWPQGEYTVKTAATDSRQFTSYTTTSFSVHVASAVCRGLAVLIYPTDISLLPIKRPDTPFELVVGHVPADLETLSIEVTQSSVCSTEADCQQRLTEGCSASTWTQIASGKKWARIWPLYSMNVSLTPTIIGLDNVSPPLTKKPVSQYMTRWNWTGNVSDTEDQFRFSIANDYGEPVSEEKIELKNVHRGIASLLRRFASWVNYVYASLGILFTLVLSIWKARPSWLGFHRKSEPTAQKQFPVVIVVSPSSKTEDSPPLDPSPRDRVRRRAHRRGE